MSVEEWDVLSLPAQRFCGLGLMSGDTRRCPPGSAAIEPVPSWLLTLKFPPSAQRSSDCRPVGTQQSAPTFRLVEKRAAAVAAVTLDGPPLPSKSSSYPVFIPITSTSPSSQTSSKSPASAGTHREKCCLSRAHKFWKRVETGRRCSVLGERGL